MLSIRPGGQHEGNAASMASRGGRQAAASGHILLGNQHNAIDLGLLSGTC